MGWPLDALDRDGAVRAGALDILRSRGFQEAAARKWLERPRAEEAVHAAAEGLRQIVKPETESRRRHPIQLVEVARNTAARGHKGAESAVHPAFEVTPGGRVAEHYGARVRNGRTNGEVLRGSVVRHQCSSASSDDKC